MKTYYIVSGGEVIGSRATEETAREYADKLALDTPDKYYGVAELIYEVRYETVKTLVKKEIV